MSQRLRVIRKAGASAAAIVLWSLLALPAFSQSSTGVITGRAQDNTGAIIPGVEVTVTSPAMIGGARSAVTDEQGIYRFTLLPVGEYRVTFALVGFKTLNIDGVNVSAGSTMTINGPMVVAAVAEEVTVTSSAPTIDLEAATVAVNWGAQKLDNLPSGHDLRNVAQMVPGMYVTTPDIGGTTMGGSTGTTALVYGRSGGEEVSVDGNAYGTIFGDYQTIEEMHISTAAKGADARTSGAQISMVLKSGGNQFHGSVMGDWEDGAWQSNNIDQKLLDRGFVPGNTNFTHYDDYNFDLGGKIIQDKLWFYGAFSHQYAGQYINGFVVEKTGEPGIFSTLLDSPTLKLTWQINNSMKLESVAQGSRKWQPYRDGSSLVPLEATQDQNAWTMNGPQLKWTYIISPTMTLTYATGRGGFWWPMLPHTTDVRKTDLTTKNIRGAYMHNYQRPIRWQNNGDWSWFRKIGSTSNEIKSGFYSLWNEAFTETFGYPNQQLYQYQSTSAEAAAGQYFLRPNSVMLFDYPNTVASITYNTAWYVNDKVTVNRKLTVNLGARYERDSSSLPVQGNPGTGPWSVKNIYPVRRDFPVYNHWAPRLSAVYDVRGDGRVVVKLGYGRYTSPGPGASNVNPASTTTYNFTNWDGSIPYQPVLPAGCASLTCALNLASVSGGTGQRTLDSSLKGSWLDEYTAGIELGLWKNYTTRLNLVRKYDHGGSRTVNLATPYEAFTDVRSDIDPGRDNIVGTADDNIVYVWSVPSSNPNRNVIKTNSVQVVGNENANLYMAYEATLNKQYSNGWSLLVTSEADFIKQRNTNPQNPNQLYYLFQEPSWNYSFKASGQRDLKWGLVYSTAYYANSGAYYGRSVQIKNALNSTVTQQVEGHVGRLPWIKLWDNRVAKKFKIGEHQTIEGFVDIFNTLNANTIRTLVTTNGPNYMKPISAGGIDASAASAVLTARLFKLGARWRF